MKSNYFSTCNSTDEIKAEFRRLAQIHHPDHGGDTATMQDINAEYAFFMNHFIRMEKPGKTEQEYTDLSQVHEALRKAIEKIINLPGISIEICCLWVWVSGDS
jgi:curved DNA-binding protein CbpA